MPVAARVRLHRYAARLPVSISMIKAKGTKQDGSPIYVFGLDAENMQRLRSGEPILVDLTQLGGTGEVLIYFGETMANLQHEIAEFIPPPRLDSKGN